MSSKSNYWSSGERGVQRLTHQERANNLLIEDDQLTSTVPAVAYQSLGQASSWISIYVPIFQISHILQGRLLDFNIISDISKIRQTPGQGVSYSFFYFFSLIYIFHCC